MSVALHLYSHLRIHQVFGANTDVGKTLFTTALCLAEIQQKNAVHYLKPVSTGSLAAADTTHLNIHVPALTRAATLIQYNDALSPHLAALNYHKAREDIPSDLQVQSAISRWISESASTATANSTLYLETAGGVHSPTPSGSSQATLLRPFRFPTILVGSPHLGGISATISAYESLVLAGYEIDAILLLAERQGAEKWGNADYLAKWTEERAHQGLRFWAIGGPALDPGAQEERWGPPPERGSRSDQEDQDAMRHWYRGLVNGLPASASDNQPASNTCATQGLSGVIQHLQARHAQRIENLNSLAQRARDSCWWPFTQHEQFKSNDDVTVIDSAYGDMFASFTSSNREGGAADSLLRPLLDSSASWWTQCLGHAHPQLALAAARAAARYGHVLFPGAANEPATKLSELLLGKQPSLSSPHPSPPGVAPWASRVFFSDDGSTGTEVAFKMAIASAEARYNTRDGTTSPATARAHKNSQSDLQATSTSTDAAATAGPPKLRTSESSYTPSTTRTSRAKLTPAVLGLRGSYHGDTIGAMDASEPSVYNARVPWYTGKGAWLGAPVVRFSDGRASVQADREGQDGGEAEWVGVRDELAALDGSASELASASASSEVVWTRGYGSLAEVYNVEHRLARDPLASIYRGHLSKLLRQIAHEHAVVLGEREGGYRFSALVLEPIILGAGGMRFVDPLFQRVLVDVVREEGEEIFGRWDDLPSVVGRTTPSFSAGEQRQDGDWRGLPVVFDEVFTGLYRLGHLSPSSSLLGVNPDILVLAKILTGGLVPMSVTIASRSIFDTFTFAGGSKTDALLHGHSYTAHAIGCEVAQETLQILGRMERGGAWEGAQADWGSSSSGAGAKKGHGSRDGEVAVKDEIGSPIWSFWSADAVKQLSCSERVRSAMALGTVLVVELVDENGGYASSAATDILRTLRTTPARDIIAAADASQAGLDSTSGDGDFSIHARPLGNVLYFMCSLNSPAGTLRSTEKALLALLSSPK